jgi:hypothetical protein
MEDRAPRVIIIDQDRAMKNVIIGLRVLTSFLCFMQHQTKKMSD